MFHASVLLKEMIDNLSPQLGDVVVDATVGAGGHSKDILEKIGPKGRLLAIDRDPMALKIAREKLKLYQEQIIFELVNFTQIDKIAQENSFNQVSGLLLDLGLSSMQIDNKKRGFSWQGSGPLDMRMSQVGLSAEDILNNYSAKDLTDIFVNYADFRPRLGQGLADYLVSQRQKCRLTTTKQLVGLVLDFFSNYNLLAKDRLSGQTAPGQTRGGYKFRARKTNIHPVTRVWQAIRIEVNAELVSLAEALPKLVDLLKPGGRVAIISFHSGEDRLVKRFFKAEAKTCVCPADTWPCVCERRPTLKILTKKPIRPSESEVNQNPRSRSARLRLAEKI